MTSFKNQETHFKCQMIQEPTLYVVSDHEDICVVNSGVLKFNPQIFGLCLQFFV